MEFNATIWRIFLCECIMSDITIKLNGGLSKFLKKSNLKKNAVSAGFLTQKMA